MKDFNKIFQQLAYRHDHSQVFNDFLEATVSAFTRGRQEQVYLDIMNKYSPEEIPLFGKLLGSLITAYGVTQDGGWSDPLGHFFEEQNSKWTRDNSGQFFTPVHLCDLMARITDPHGSICDPCCGSGRNLVAADRLDPLNRYRNFYTAMDVDRRCVNMTVINMVLYGMKGVVIHMNTLSMEIYKGYRVYLPETGLGVIPMDKQACRGFVINDHVEELATVYVTRKQAA